MSASLEMQFQMTKGSDEDFLAVCDVLQKIGGLGIKDITRLKDYDDEDSEERLDPEEAEKIEDFMFWSDIGIEYHSFVIDNQFPNIWGDDYLETDPKPYILFAKAAPKAEWTASSDRCYEVDGTTSNDKASYSNGVLQYEYSDYQSFDAEEDEDDEIDDEDDDFRPNKKIWPIKHRYIIKEYFLDGKKPEALEGKTFVITDKLQYFEKRDAMTDYIEKKGGHVAGSVSKKTAFLVCNDGDSTSSKARKAAELGVPVITEGEFIGRFGFPGEYDEE